MGRDVTAIRPAAPSDIRGGAVILYIDGDDGPFIRVVDEVLRPSDPWKAYCADDGCRYGLDGAYYVEALQRTEQEVNDVQTEWFRFF